MFCYNKHRKEFEMGIKRRNFKNEQSKSKLNINFLGQTSPAIAKHF